MRNHFEFAAFKFRIFIFQSIEAVRAGAKNLAELVLGKIGDIFSGRSLEEVLLTETAGEIRVAPLLGHDTKAQTGGFQDLYHRTGNLLGPLIKGSRAADPVENIDRTIRIHDREIKTLGPVEP